MFIVTNLAVYNVNKTSEEITLQKLEVWKPGTRPYPHKFTWKGDVMWDEVGNLLKLFVDGEQVYGDGQILRVTDTLEEADLVTMYCA